MRADDIFAKAIAKAASDMAERASRGKPTTLPAEYRGRDSEGKPWVLLPGATDPTPVRRMSVEAEVGDTVSVTVGDGRAVVDANISNPSAGRQSVETLRRETNEVRVKQVEQTNTFKRMIEAEQVRTKGLESETATITVKLEAANADISDLNVNALRAGSAVIQDLQAHDAEISGKLTAAEAEIGSLSADNAEIHGTLTAHEGVIDSLDSNYAHITEGVIDNATIGHADVDGLSANYATVANLNAANGRIDSLESSKADISYLQANYIDADTIDADYAHADLANVNNAWITNGVIQTAAIVDEQVFTVTGNKATISEINADNITVRNLHTSNLTVDTADGYVTIGSKKTPTKEYIDSLKDELQQEIDGAVETWTSTAVPLLSNYPASQWTVDGDAEATAALRAKHVGDICYVQQQGSDYDGFCYRFSYSGGEFSWVLIKDSSVTKALGDISDLQEFQSDTTSWIDETEQGLTTIRQNHTNLSGVVDKTVKSSTQLWYTKANTTAPSKPTSKVTSTATTGDGWRTVVPAWNASYPNYYYCWQFELADGTYAWGDVVRDIAMGESQGTSRSAQSTANANIKSSVQLWFTKANSTAPSKPTAQVTTNNPATGNAWNLAVPTYSATYPHYFYCYQQQKGDGTYQWSDVVYDVGTTEAMQKAQAALPSSTFTTFQSTTFKELVDEVDEQSSTITTMSERIDVIDSSLNLLPDSDEDALSGGEYISSSGNSAYISAQFFKLGSDKPQPELANGIRWTLLDGVGNKNRCRCWAGKSPALKKGETYTVSWWMRVTSGSAKPHMESYSKGADISEFWDALTVDDGWKRIVYTFTMDDDTSNDAYQNGYFYIGVGGNNVAAVAETCGYRLVPGSSAESVDGKVTTLTNTVNTVKQTADTNKASITSLTKTVSDNKTAIENRASSIEQTVDGIETDISSMQAEISTKADGSTVTTLTNKVNTIDETVDGHTQRITATETVANGVRSDLDNLEIGGRNLLRWTASPTYAGANVAKNVDSTGWYSWTASAGIADTEDGIKASFTANSTGFVIPFIDDDTVDGLTDYMLSFDYRGTVTLDAFTVYALARSGSNLYTTASAPLVASETEWKHVEVAIKWPTFSGRKAVSMLMPYNATNGKWLEIRDGSMKLEKGNHATDWTPAPEDLETEVTSLKTDYASFKNTVNEFEATVGRVTSVRYRLLRGSWTDATWRTYEAADYSTNWNNENIVNGSSSPTGFDSTTLKVGDIIVVEGVSTDSKSQHSISVRVTSVPTSSGGAIPGKTIGGTNATGLANRISTAETSISSNADAIALRATKTEAQGYARDAVDNLEIGGRNLFSWPVSGTKWKDEEHALNTYQNRGSFTQFTNSLLFDPLDTVGEEYTISFDVKSPNGTTNVELYNSNGLPSAFYFTSVTVAQNVGDEWVHCEHTVTNEAYSGSGTPNPNLNRRIEIYARSATGVLVRKIKVEKGTKATDWTPAPEDMEAYADAAVTAAKAEIKVTTDGISSEVSKKVGSSEIISKINQSAESVTIDAAKVNIAGAAIFTSGRLSESSLDAAYDAKGAAATVQDNLDNLQIGGRNLLRHSDTLGDSNWWRQNSITSIADGEADPDGGTGAVLITPSASSWWLSALSENCLLKDVDAEYTASIWLRADTSTRCNICVRYLRSDYVDGTSSSATTRMTVTVPTTWTRFTITGTLMMAQTTDNFWIGQKTTTPIYAYHPKMEKGNKATDWSPAPEDVDAAIDAAQDTADAAAPKTSAVARSQRIYWRATSTAGKPGVNNTWLATGGTGYGNWALTVPQLTSGSTKYPYLYTCVQSQTVSQQAAGTACSCSPVLLDDTTTVIDGGNIITGSVAANAISASSGTFDTANIPALTADHIKANVISAVNGGTGTINADKINVSDIAIGNLDGYSALNTRVSSGESALTKVNYYNRFARVGQSTSTTTNPWYKVASSAITTQYVDYEIVFDVFNTGGFVTNGLGDQSCGRLFVHYRAGSGINSVESPYIKWENRGSNIALASFVLAYKLTSSSRIDAEIWVKCDRSYSGYYFQVVYDNQREQVTETSPWTLSNTWSAGSASAITSGYTQVASTDMSTAFITRIDENGIRVHPASTENNRLELKAAGTQVYKGGYLKADYADTITLYGGSNASGANPSVSLSSSDFKMIDSGGAQRILLNAGNGAIIGKPTAGHTQITDAGAYFYDANNKKRSDVTASGLQVYDTDGTTRVASFGASGSELYANGALRHKTDVDGSHYYSDDGVSEILEITTCQSGQTYYGEINFPGYNSIYTDEDGITVSSQPYNGHPSRISLRMVGVAGESYAPYVSLDSEGYASMSAGGDELIDMNASEDNLRLAGNIEIDGPFRFDELPNAGTNADFFATGIQAFANGGRLRYKGLADFKSWLGLGAMAYKASLAASDIPSLDTSKIGTGTLSRARGGTGMTSIATTNFSNSGLSVANDTATDITFDGNAYFTFPSTGIFLMTCSVCFLANATGLRAVNVNNTSKNVGLNYTDLNSFCTPAASGEPTKFVWTSLVNITDATQKWYMSVKHTAGAALTVRAYVRVVKIFAS